MNKPISYKCKSKENNGKHIYVIPMLVKGNEYTGVCRLCGNERIHTMGVDDAMWTGRKSMALKNAKRQQAKEKEK